jgi:hypothetical protein
MGDKLVAVKRGEHVLTDAGKKAALSCEENDEPPAHTNQPNRSER